MSSASVVFGSQLEGFVLVLIAPPNTRTKQIQISRTISPRWASHHPRCCRQVSERKKPLLTATSPRKASSDPHSSSGLVCFQGFLKNYQSHEISWKIVMIAKCCMTLYIIFVGTSDAIRIWHQVWGIMREWKVCKASATCVHVRVCLPYVEIYGHIYVHIRCCSWTCRISTNVCWGANIPTSQARIHGQAMAKLRSQRPCSLPAAVPLLQSCQREPNESHQTYYRSPGSSPGQDGHNPWKQPSNLLNLLIICVGLSTMFVWWIPILAS